MLPPKTLPDVIDKVKVMVMLLQKECGVARVEHQYCIKAVKSRHCGHGNSPDRPVPPFVICKEVMLHLRFATHTDGIDDNESKLF